MKRKRILLFWHLVAGRTNFYIPFLVDVFSCLANLADRRFLKHNASLMHYVASNSMKNLANDKQENTWILNYNASRIPRISSSFNVFL
jgi:hypothetical protein